MGLRVAETVVLGNAEVGLNSLGDTCELVWYISLRDCAVWKDEDKGLANRDVRMCAAD
jgi:hypothetical protein